VSTKPKEAALVRKEYTNRHQSTFQVHPGTFLPNFILVESAGNYDAIEAAEDCAGRHTGEIVVFDKAYIDFRHLHALNQRGIF